jgi:cytochrome b561
MMSTQSINSVGQDQQRYDILTIALHWATALIVIFLFASSQIWGYLPWDSFLRRNLQSLHISFGITLAALIIIRLIWRLTLGRKLPAVNSTLLMQRLANLVHRALYLLLIAQIILGFLFRWSQGEPLSAFGLLTLPDIGINPMLRHTFATLHFYNAWIIIIVSGLHAGAALFHHYILRDSTLRRMIRPQR